MPKRITAKMLADLARRKAGCGDGAGLGQSTIRGWPSGRYAYVRVHNPMNPSRRWGWNTVEFWYADYGSPEAAKQAAWNFLMERPDKEGE